MQACNVCLENMFACSDHVLFELVCLLDNQFWDFFLSHKEEITMALPQFPCKGKRKRNWTGTNLFPWLQCFQKHQCWGILIQVLGPSGSNIWCALANHVPGATKAQLTQNYGKEVVLSELEKEKNKEANQRSRIPLHHKRQYWPCHHIQEDKHGSMFQNGAGSQNQLQCKWKEREFCWNAILHWS